MQQVTVGDPWDQATDFGPLITAEHRNKVHGFVTRAKEIGATITSEGTPLDQPGTYYSPTLITDARQDSEIVQGEVCGPVLTVIPFDDEQHALHHPNDSYYGLASTVWTNDVARAQRVIQQIEAGVTWVNDPLPITSEDPHGGVKSSGCGRDMGYESRLGYAVTHHIMVKHHGQARAAGCARYLPSKA